MQPIINRDLIQGSPDWLVWRHKGLGASELAEVMNESPYGTALELYKVKIAPHEAGSIHDTNVAMVEGHEREPQVRAAYEFTVDADFPPACATHPEHDWKRASLDGWNTGLEKGIEIKRVGRDAYESEVIPRHHLIQMHWQMIVCGVLVWIYIKTMDGQNFKALEVMADPQLLKEVEYAGEEMWARIQSKNPPPPCDRDWIGVHDDVLAALLIKVEGAKGKAKDELRDQVFARVTHQRVISGRVKIMKTEKKKMITFPKEAASAA